MLKYNAHDPFPLYRHGNKSYQKIVCDRCGGADERTATNGPVSPKILERHWRVKSWEIDIGRGSFICPVCVRKEIEYRRKEKETKKMEKATNIVEMPASQSSALAKKIMSDLLFDHYDLSMQDYKDGWDDARIAKESGLSENFVAQRRAADYGPAKPKKPPAIKQAQTSLTQSYNILRDLISRVQAIEVKAKEALTIVEGALTTIANDQSSK